MQEADGLQSRENRRGGLMNPFEKAWRLLKMTPDEMRQQGFSDAAKQMEEMKQEEERVRQQAQATAPKMTPRLQQYNLQLARQQAQRDMDRKVRRARKAGGRLDHMFPEMYQFEQEHGRPPIMPKALKNRYMQYRARMEEE